MIVLFDFKNDKILTSLMNKSNYKTVFGIFEYVDGVRDSTLNYRKDLEHSTKLLNIIEIKDQQLVESIEVAYRMAYLRDSVINDGLQETTLNMISKYTLIKTMEILKELISNEAYYSQLTIIQTSEVGLNNRENLKRVKFLNEIMRTFKQLQIISLRNEIIAMFNNNNSIFQFIKKYLCLISQIKYSNKLDYLNENGSQQIDDNNDDYFDMIPQLFIDICKHQGEVPISQKSMFEALY